MNAPPSDYGIAAPSYRLPAATHVGPVRLQVADVSRSVVYYTEVLGLAVSRSTGARAQLAAPGDQAALIELVELPGARPAPRQRRLGLFHFALLVPDRASLGRFVRHLADRGIGAGSADHAVSEAIYLTDPDGLGIEVYADRPRAAWRTSGRELFMTTEPLDLRGLARAAGEQAWTGMPPGTVMGHVHLHVGDLDAAAAFYHRGLGLDQMVWSYPGALFLSAGGYHHHLAVNTWAGAAPPARPDEARLLEWTLVLPDTTALEAAARSLEMSGYSTSTDVHALVADPWGTPVRLDAGGATQRR